MVILLASPVLGIVRKLIQGDLADRFELTLNSRRRWILDRVLWKGDRFETRAARDYIRNFPRVIFALSGLRSIAKKERPDFVLSFLTKTNLNSIVALSGEKNSGPVLAVCERNDVCRQPLPAGLERGREELYPLANSVLANSRHAVEDLNEMNPTLNSQWLPNLALATTVEPCTNSSRSGVPSKRFVVVGRLEASKRVEMSIRAFSLSGLAAEGWGLRIVGDGPERGKLLDLASRHNLEQAVEFVPPVKEWWNHSSTPEAVILASDYEGFPNVFSEAVAARILPLVRNSVEEVRFVLGSQLHQDLGFTGVEDLTKLLRKTATDSQWRAHQIQKVTDAFSVYSGVAEQRFQGALQNLVIQRSDHGPSPVTQHTTSAQPDF